MPIPQPHKSRYQPILLGLVSGILVFFAMLLISSQYSDYRALSNSEDVLAALRPVQ